MKKSKYNWYNARCAGAKKIRDAVWERWRKQCTESNREQYREAGNDYLRIRREEEIKFEKDIVDKCKDEPKFFYRHIRGKMTNREVIEELDKDGTTYKTAQEMSEIMNQSFKTVFCMEEEFSEPRSELGVSG